CVEVLLSRLVLCSVLLASCAHPDPGAVPLRRLTPTELNNTLRDLLGLSGDGWYDDQHPYDEESGAVAWPWAFTPDVPVDGMEGMAEGQVVSPVFAEQVERAATHFSTYTATAPRFWVCEPEDLDADALSACAHESVLKLAARAWRRPLTKDETERLTLAFEAWEREHGTLDAITVASRALLQTPQFLYLVEDGAPGRREAFALASRLSYTLWDSMPDAALFQAADRGHLGSEREVRRELRRMLADPRARQAVAHFHRQWLGLDGPQARCARQAADEARCVAHRASRDT
ncbi:MAG: DUF1592 domain-containing protein, partial [Myxococcales bacterium]|nr:DUF1592 domain-containing protein [Myxococcales bacterium]